MDENNLPPYYDGAVLFTIKEQYKHCLFFRRFLWDVFWRCRRIFAYQRTKLHWREKTLGGRKARALCCAAYLSQRRWIHYAHRLVEGGYHHVWPFGANLVEDKQTKGIVNGKSSDHYPGTVLNHTVPLDGASGIVSILAGKRRKRLPWLKCLRRFYHGRIQTTNSVFWQLSRILDEVARFSPAGEWCALTKLLRNTTMTDLKNVSQLLSGEVMCGY